MDKKELNDLIDRVALTGPGGVNKVKKILKELANGSGGSGSGCDCPGAMFVHGTIQEGNEAILFVPNSGEPSSGDAMKHIENGGTLYIVVSPRDGNELTLPLAFIQTFGRDTGLGFVMRGDSIVWIYEPEPDFSVNIDFNNPSIDYGDDKFWFTTLDESAVGNADACMLTIDNYETNSVILVKDDSGVFGNVTGSVSWYLKTKEVVLEDNPVDIPETVKYVVVYHVPLS